MDNRPAALLAGTGSAPPVVPTWDVSAANAPLYQRVLDTYSEAKCMALAKAFVRNDTWHARFYDRLVHDGAQWRILSRTPIYEKDSLLPVKPGQHIDIPADAIQKYPRGFCHLAHMQASGGATITTNIPAHNSEAQARLYEGGAAWLNETA